MSRYDCVDEAVIDATPSEIIAAFADEYAGRTQWWMPTFRARVRDGCQWPEVGCVRDVAASARPGGADRRDAVRQVLRVTDVEPDRRIVEEQVEGPFRGTVEWVFTPIGDRRTRVAVFWKGRSVGLWSVVLRFFDVEREHSQLDQAGFRAMQQFFLTRSRP
jgi:hypothetical protein